MHCITSVIGTTALTAQRLQVEGAVLDDVCNGYHRAGNRASGTRHLCIQLVADLQCSMMAAFTMLMHCTEIGVCRLQHG